MRDALHEYGVTLTRLEDVHDVDCVIVAVAHDEFKKLSLEDLNLMYREMPDEKKVLIDVKGLLDIKTVEKQGFRLWRL